MKKIKIEITKKHPSGLEKGLVKRVVPTVAVKLMVDGYAKQVEEDGVKTIDINQLKKNRAGNPSNANKLSTLKQNVLASVTVYNNLNRQAEIVEARLKNDSDNEALQGLSKDALSAADKAFKKMKTLSSKYEGLIEENSKDSIEIPEAGEKVETPQDDDVEEAEKEEQNRTEYEVVGLKTDQDSINEKLEAAEKDEKTALEALTDKPEDAKLKTVATDATKVVTDLKKELKTSKAKMKKIEDTQETSWWDKMAKKVNL